MNILQKYSDIIYMIIAANISQGVLLFMMVMKMSTVKEGEEKDPANKQCVMAVDHIITVTIAIMLLSVLLSTVVMIMGLLF